MRAACLRLPEVVERLSHGAPSLFVPPYVGGRGWLGVRVDGDPDEDEVAAICGEAYRTVAPRILVARLEAEAAVTRSPRRAEGGPGGRCPGGWPPARERWCCARSCATIPLHPRLRTEPGVGYRLVDPSTGD